MQTNPKVLPRFIPTLTEVVTFPVEPQPPSIVFTAEGQINPEDLVDRVMMQLKGPINASVQAAVDEFLASHLVQLRPRIAHEIDRVLRQKLGEVLAAELAGKKFV